MFIVGKPRQMNNTDSESEKHIFSFLVGVVGMDGMVGMVGMANVVGDCDDCDDDVL